MPETLKIKVDFENENAKALVNFIVATQEGKYTKEVPVLTQITFQRLQIQEQDKSHQFDENNDEIILFGVSY